MGKVDLNSSYDIVVIGAGPAGSSAALAAAQRGARVLLIDRRQRIGIPVQCAEFVPQWISRRASFSSACVVQTVDKMVTHFPDETFYEMKSPGYMLDRSLFDKELAASAALAGAEISIETTALNVSPEGLAVERGAEKEIIRSKIFIGADGVHSSIARFVGQPPLKNIVALQYEVVMPEPQNHVDVYFHKDYEGGYAWFFPKGTTANVGLGVIAQKTAHLLERMDYFLDYLVRSKKLSSVEIVAKTGGSIPCENPRRRVFENILLVGDAAGHAHSITGAGVLNAVIAGEIAGRIAAEAVERGNLRHLQNYEIECQETFGKFLAYGASKREFLEKNWNEPGVDFEGLFRKTWVGFKEYYEGRRKAENHALWERIDSCFGIPFSSYVTPFSSLVIPAKAGIQGEGEEPVNKRPAVYILASKRNGTLYIGVTSDLVKRIWEHRNNMVEGFTKRYNVHYLVWYELHENMESAIQREKRLKEWKRVRKLELIESANPNWQDLYDRTV